MSVYVNVYRDSPLYQFYKQIAIRLLQNPIITFEEIYKFYENTHKKCSKRGYSTRILKQIEKTFPCVHIEKNCKLHGKRIKGVIVPKFNLVQYLAQKELECKGLQLENKRLAKKVNNLKYRGNVRHTLYIESRRKANLLQEKLDQYKKWNVQLCRRFRRLKKRLEITENELIDQQPLEITKPYSTRLYLVLIRLYHIIGNASKVVDVFNRYHNLTLNI